MSATMLNTSRVLPTPPGPTAVSMRCSAIAALSAARSATRPTNDVNGDGSATERAASPVVRVAAIAARARRSLTCNLRSMDETWLSTVRTEMNSRAAISAFVRCSPSATSTSASRAEMSTSGCTSLLVTSTLCIAIRTCPSPPRALRPRPRQVSCDIRLRSPTTTSLSAIPLTQATHRISLSCGMPAHVRLTDACWPRSGSTVPRTDDTLGAQRPDSLDMTPAGFHEGELAVQRRAGVEHLAARLESMLDRPGFGDGLRRFLAERDLAVLTGRDCAGRLWASPLTGQPGMLNACGTRLCVAVAPAAGDPLAGLPTGQPVGLLAIEFATRRRVRVNGTLIAAGGPVLEIEVAQAYGNCPQFIQQRLLRPALAATSDGSARAAGTPRSA